MGQSAKGQGCQGKFQHIRLGRCDTDHENSSLSPKNVTVGGLRQVPTGRYDFAIEVVEELKAEEMSREVWLVGLGVLTWIRATGVTRLDSVQNATWETKCHTSFSA
jgi:hypothetical protein